MSGLTARNVHLTDQVLAALAERAHEPPMTTAEVAQAIGQPPWRQDTWRVLDRLTRRGTVERIVDDNGICRRWRLVDDGSAATLDEWLFREDGAGACG